MRIKLKKKLLIPLFIGFTSFWYWKLNAISWILSLLLLISGSLLFSYYLNKNKIKLYLIILLFVLTSQLGFRNNFYKDIFNQTNLEKDLIEKRHEYYANTFGRLYKNRIGIYLNKQVSTPVYKFEQNLFINLDPNIYFFKGHPRERGGVDEFRKFSLLLVPFFLIGIYKLLNKNSFGWIYFSLSTLLAAFIYPGNPLGPFLFFPFFVAAISIGINYLLLKYEK